MPHGSTDVHHLCTNVQLESVTVDERDLAEVARAYYVVGETMDVIARRLQVSRSTVSRLLSEARRLGIVQISVIDDVGPRTDLQRHLDPLGVHAHVVDVRPGAPPLARLDAVARATGHLVTSLMHDEALLGLAWGTTMGAVVDRLPARPLRKVAVVQLNGAASARTTGIAYAGDLLAQAARAYDATVQQFPVPTFFDFAETRTALWRESAVRRVLDLHAHLDIALFGIGAFTAELPSHVYQHHYLAPQDVARLRALDVVGDVCTVFLREDGTWADIEINARASGPTPADLARVPRRIAVVAGQAKVPAVVGALRSGAVTDLVLDSHTASALRRRLEEPHRIRPRR